MSEQKIKCWRGYMGSMVVDTEVTGLTQKLPQDDRCAYGGKTAGVFFIGESMSCAAVKILAEALGFEYMGEVKP